MDLIEIALDPRDELDRAHRGSVSGDLYIAADALCSWFHDRDRQRRRRRELRRRHCGSRRRWSRYLGLGCGGYIEWSLMDPRHPYPAATPRTVASTRTKYTRCREVIKKSNFTTTSPLRQSGVGTDIGGRRESGSGGLRRSRRWEQLTPIGPAPHLLGCRRGNEFILCSDLPAAPQGLVERGQPRRHIAFRHRQIVLRRVEVLLGSQHGRKIPGTQIVLQKSEPERGVRCGDAFAQ